MCIFVPNIYAMVTIKQIKFDHDEIMRDAIKKFKEVVK